MNVWIRIVQLTCHPQLIRLSALVATLVLGVIWGAGHVDGVIWGA